MNGQPNKQTVPEWVFEFHGHRCPFMPIGWRMGMALRERLGAGREPDHGMFVFSEMGEGHPQTCMMDGLQASTGCTYGKNLLIRLGYGKIAAVLYDPRKGALRASLRPEIQEGLGRFEFFNYRKKGMEPSEIPAAVCNEVIEYVLSRSDEDLFVFTLLPDFSYKPTPVSHQKGRCQQCGEYVFERYLRVKDGRQVCLPCSAYERNLSAKPVL